MAKLDAATDEVRGKLLILLDLFPDAFRCKYEFDCFFFPHHLQPLGMLCALKMPEDVLLRAYRICPEAANDAFHVPCYFGANIHVIQWLYSKNQEVVQNVCMEFGTVPLHFACIGGSLDVVEFVYDKFPEALEYEDDNGSTPLHDALRWSPLAIVKFLLEQSNDKHAICNHENELGFTPLLCAIHNSDPAILEAILEKYPSCARALSSGNSGWLPLHSACSAGRCASAKLLLTYYPAATKIRDEMGRLPLTLLACRHNKKQDSEEDFDELVELLVRYHPDSASDMDEDGKPVLDLPTCTKLMKRMALQIGRPESTKRQRLA